MPERLVLTQVPHWLREMATGAVTRILSTKRGVVLAAAAVLLLIAFMIGFACALWIGMNGDLGWGAVMALGSITGIVATLAGVAYRKPETPLPGGNPVGASAPTTPEGPVPGSRGGGGAH